MLTKEQKEKWRYVFLIFLINCVVTTTLFGIIYLYQDTDIIGIYKNYYPLYFQSWDRFRLFFNNEVFETIIREEIYARGPTWFLINLKIKYNAVLAYIALVISGAIWAQAHPLFAPVFIVGLTWGWLIIKTRSFWPAIICHGMANMFIYFAVKMLQYFQIIT